MTVAAPQPSMLDVLASPNIEPHGVVSKKHSHYYKNVTHLEFVDVYRVLDMFGVSDPCIQHAVKKLLVAGGRGAGKDITRDIQESVDTLMRWLEMRTEDRALAEINALDMQGLHRV